MKNLFSLFYLLVSVVFLVYLLLPTPRFPNPPPDSVQSQEEADTETPLRRAYFTNYTREQVIAHYRNQFRPARFTLRLNYPPEDAQTLIRDQTRSVYLEELVHPFRESIYINGFEARQPQDDIWYKGVHYGAKITVKYVYSSLLTRFLIAIPTLILGYVLAQEIFAWRRE